MDSDASEVELKFTLEPARGAEILAWLGQGRRPTRQDLTSIYFDTADRALRLAGFVLRVREDGGAWTQAVKSAVNSGGRLGRGEWEAPLSSPVPDLSAARRTPAKSILRRDARLEIQFVVEVERLAVEIRGPDSVIEACLDSGAAEAGDRRAPIDELELELKGGSPEALLALARRLQETWPVGLSVVTKADRGFALAEQGILSPRRFRAPRLTTRMTAGAAFQAVARAALEQIVWNAEVLRSGPVEEAIHQARVGIRRLRATLKTFKPIVGDGRLPALTARLKWLSGELDPARNLDVFIDGAWARAPTHHPAAGETAVHDARTAAYERARAAAADPRLGLLMLDLSAWVEFGPWTLDDADQARKRDRALGRFAAAALERAHSRLLDMGEHLGDLNAEGRHRLRIGAKGLRYAADVFDQVFQQRPKRARRFLAALESLLEILGDLNDIATARTLAPAFDATPDVLSSEGARERDLIANAKAAWTRFQAARPYWRD